MTKEAMGNRMLKGGLRPVMEWSRNGSCNGVGMGCKMRRGHEFVERTQGSSRHSLGGSECRTMRVLQGGSRGVVQGE